MGASSIQCSACSKDVIATEEPFVCVQVRGQSCTTVDAEMMNENSGETICLVHEECFERFEKLVGTGVYPGPNSN